MCQLGSATAVIAGVILLPVKNYVSKDNRRLATQCGLMGTLARVDSDRKAFGMVDDIN